jgi:hypothetical protein
VRWKVVREVSREVALVGRAVPSKNRHLQAERLEYTAVAFFALFLFTTEVLLHILWNTGDALSFRPMLNVRWRNGKDPLNVFHHPFRHFMITPSKLKTLHVHCWTPDINGWLVEVTIGLTRAVTSSEGLFFFQRTWSRSRDMTRYVSRCIETAEYRLLSIPCCFYVHWARRIQDRSKV